MIKKLRLRKKHEDTYFKEIYEKINEIIEILNEKLT